MSKKTDFGFKKVDKNDKQGLVANVFNSVADNYDLMNDLMSLGIHRLWKKEFIKELNPQNDTKLLDMAGGTGDISYRYLDKVKGEAFICDINYEMLKNGKNRAFDEGYKVNISCVNAEEIPFKDESFDYYTISFGIRNVTNIDLALKEAYRVLKPGGKFLCLEFSHISNPLMAKIYDGYSFNVIPKLGELVAKDRDSYQYLVESIRKFPNQEKFKELIEDAGFKAKYRNLNFGVVAIHSGQK